MRLCLLHACIHRKTLDGIEFVVGHFQHSNWLPVISKPAFLTRHLDGSPLGEK